MKHLRFFLLSTLLLSVLLSIGATVGFSAEITLESLLNEMIDRTAIAQFPDPMYTCKQASSYDRASVSPDQPGWFANGDASQFIREEMHGDRKEWVLMDENGPGAIVRWWITAPHYKAKFRIYLDGDETPAVTAKIDDLVGGEFFVGAPLSEATANGRNLYLPIPYARSCKITVDDMPTQQNLYYQINFRTYPKGTVVKTLSIDNLDDLEKFIAQVQEELLAPPDILDSKNVGSYRIESKTSVGMPLKFGSPHYFAAIRFRLEAEDPVQALRSLILRLKFDDRETVCCPIGDLFGTGVGINPYRSWYTSVEEDGTMVIQYPMPFKSDVEVGLQNLSDQDIRIFGAYDLRPYEWNENSMYFHCNWRQDHEIQTVAGDGTQDWTYLEAKGKGVFAGDTLSVLNRHTAWWGEGDEKIYVDGETFPSHFGTGTEDYYGYAWCTPQFFESPFHAQPRAEGPQNFGHTTNSRYRLLDGIPFTKSFKFDMEVWHWVATKIDYSVVTYWYSVGSAVVVNKQKNLTEEAARKVEYNTEYVLDIPGFKIINKPQGNLSIQGMKGFGTGWHNDEQLWWTGTQPGNELVLKVNTPDSGPQKLVVSMTQAIDYGIVQFWLDGQKIGNPVDLFNNGVIPSGPVEIGTLDLAAGDHELKIVIEGKNEKSTGYLFGMDKYEFVPVR